VRKIRAAATAERRIVALPIIASVAIAVPVLLLLGFVFFYHGDEEREARTLAAKKGVSVTWEHRDMSDLPWDGVFDGAFAMGNSFGYAGDEHDARFLRAVARALKPGGRFVLDYPAVAEALLPHFQERTWLPIGDTLFLRAGRYDPAAGRIETEYTLIQAGKSETKPWTQRVYTYREFCRLVTDAGFTDLQGYASTSLEPFKLGSQGLLLTARKSKTG